MKLFVREDESLQASVDFLNSKVEMLERELAYYANREVYQTRKVTPIMTGLQSGNEVPVLVDQGFRARLVLGIK